MATKPALGAGALILIVEDNAAHREALALILRGEGYEPLTAADGQEALERLRAGPAPALVLLDMMMPEVDGWGVMEQLRREPGLGSAPMLLMAEEGADPEWAASLGGAGLVVKPLEAARLLAAIRTTLRQRP
jgi:CheY-like chemotaxis protein